MRQTINNRHNFYIFENELSGTSKSVNIPGCKIFAKISIPFTILMLGLLKNEFASTAKNFLFFNSS